MGARSIKKGPFVDWKLLKKINEINKENGVQRAKTWSRRSTILPSFIDKTIFIHNGKKMIPVLITENMVGRKLGEFSPTRNFKSHNNTKN